MTEDYLKNCLYFTASRLCRAMNRIAEEEFRITGLSPTYAFLIMLVQDRPGITQKELSEKLHVTQSTLTRFIDKLEQKGLVERTAEGKSSHISLTKKGLELLKDIGKAWKNLYIRYSELLGEQEGKELTSVIYDACLKLDS